MNQTYYFIALIFSHQFFCVLIASHTFTLTHTHLRHISLHNLLFCFVQMAYLPCIVNSESEFLLIINDFERTHYKIVDYFSFEKIIQSNMNNVKWTLNIITKIKQIWSNEEKKKKKKEKNNERTVSIVQIICDEICDALKKLIKNHH